MTCRRIEPLLETFADAELSPAQAVEVEAHILECERCAEQLRLMEAIKASTRRAVEADVSFSSDFLARVEQAMVEEERRQYAQVVRRPWAAALRGVFPAFGMAAGVLLYLALRDAESPREGRTAPPLVAAAQVTMEGALDRLIDYHSSPPESQVTEANLLPTFEPNVGVRIRAPELGAYGAHWEGASLVPVVNHQAAFLRYRMPGHRVTVYVFDPRKVPVHNHLERRVVGDDPIYIGQWRGYSVAARENRGVGYAMAADLDDQAITQLIRSIH
jgi:anti-sigma factor RsiW